MSVYGWWSLEALYSWLNFIVSVPAMPESGFIQVLRIVESSVCEFYVCILSVNGEFLCTTTALCSWFYQCQCHPQLQSIFTFFIFFIFSACSSSYQHTHLARLLGDGSWSLNRKTMLHWFINQRGARNYTEKPHYTNASFFMYDVTFNGKNCQEQEQTLFISSGK